MEKIISEDEMMDKVYKEPEHYLLGLFISWGFLGILCFYLEPWFSIYICYLNKIKIKKIIYFMSTKIKVGVRLRPFIDSEKK